MKRRGSGDRLGPEQRDEARRATQAAGPSAYSPASFRESPKLAAVQTARIHRSRPDPPVVPIAWFRRPPVRPPNVPHVAWGSTLRVRKAALTYLVITRKPCVSGG